jgi:hypothetical protein
MDVQVDELWSDPHKVATFLLILPTFAHLHAIPPPVVRLPQLVPPEPLPELNPWQ